MSALASPDTFVWSRLADAALSVADQIALETHARVERWALDEVPLSGKLVHQLIEWLYREDRFCRGELRIDKPAGPHSVSAPTLAIVNTADDIAPLDSVRPFNESLATPDARIIEYPGRNWRGSAAPRTTDRKALPRKNLARDNLLDGGAPARL
jgi:polyhydroxyalkanoate synthase